jgi:hypothetical protein
MNSVEDRLEKLEVRCDKLGKDFTKLLTGLEQLLRSTREMIDLHVFWQKDVEDILERLSGAPGRKGN